METTLLIHSLDTLKKASSSQNPQFSLVYEDPYFPPHRQPLDTLRWKILKEKKSAVILEANGIENLANAGIQSPPLYFSPSNILLPEGSYCNMNHSSGDWKKFSWTWNSFRWLRMASQDPSGLSEV